MAKKTAARPKNKPAKGGAKPSRPAPKAKSVPKAKVAPKAAAGKPVLKPVLKSVLKPVPKPIMKPPAHAPAAPAAGAADKPIRKGITIVGPKPVKKAKPKAAERFPIAHLAGSLLGAGAVRKPLIQSGPNAPASPAYLRHGGPGEPPKQHKSPFGKKETDRFRQTLVRKRAEVLGDISTMEREALHGNSGSLSNLPQHIAEQGSDAYEQSLALDLAAADRKLIKEIDEAIARIDNGTYGVCQITGKPIKAERLEELPWARYSIEAAREMERHGVRS